MAYRLIAEADFEIVNEVKQLLGDSEMAFNSNQIYACVEQAVEEIEGYCNRSIEEKGLKSIATQIAIIKLNRLGSEGLNSQNYSGISENYMDGYPANIMAILNRKRKAKVL